MTRKKRRINIIIYRVSVIISIYIYVYILWFHCAIALYIFCIYICSFLCNLQMVFAFKIIWCLFVFRFDFYSIFSLGSICIGLSLSLSLWLRLRLWLLSLIVYSTTVHGITSI